MTGTKRLGLVAVGVVALLLAFLLLRPNDNNDSSSTAARPTSTATAPRPTTTTSATAPAGDGTAEAPATPAPTFNTVRIVDGQPQGGIKTLSYVKGDTVRLRVRSDIADEIHIHGYDLKNNVAAGGTTQFTFPASIEGKFEIELENAGTQIASLEVNPS